LFTVKGRNMSIAESKLQKQFLPAAQSLKRELSAWRDQAPSFNGAFTSDSHALSDFVRRGEQLLAQLPPKPQRDKDQLAQSQCLHDACRSSRSAFMRLHARAVYRSLATEPHGHRHLSELAFAAAELVPGLMPTPVQIARECEYRQADKEQREIDQAIFFHALLDLPDIGTDIVRRLLQPSAKALGLLPQFRREGRLELEALTIERRGRVCHITVNNASCLNAEDNQLIDNMETAIDLTLLDDGCAVGVLRGAPMTHPRYLGKRVFSAGINLKHLHQGKISYLDFLLRREFGYINKMARGLMLELDMPDTGAPRIVEKPWIAAVESFAIGGGAQILLVCDRVIAAHESYFSLPAAHEGIVPGVANLRLGKRAGMRLARQIILDGRKVWANEPDGVHLFDEVVQAPDMDAAIDAAARRLDSPAVIANRKMLRLAEEPLDAFRAYMAEFTLEQARRMYSEDVLQKVGKA